MYSFNNNLFFLCVINIIIIIFIIILGKNVFNLKSKHNKRILLSIIITELIIFVCFIIFSTFFGEKVNVETYKYEHFVDYPNQKVFYYTEDNGKEKHIDYHNATVIRNTTKGSSYIIVEKYRTAKIFMLNKKLNKDVIYIYNHTDKVNVDEENNGYSEDELLLMIYGKEVLDLLPSYEDSEFSIRFGDPNCKRKMAEMEQTEQNIKLFFALNYGSSVMNYFDMSIEEFVEPNTPDWIDMYGMCYVYHYGTMSYIYDDGTRKLVYGNGVTFLTEYDEAIKRQEEKYSLMNNGDIAKQIDSILGTYASAEKIASITEENFAYLMDMWSKRYQISLDNISYDDYDSLQEYIIWSYEIK